MSALKLDPMIKAIHTREMLEDRLWRAIVTLYHVEAHAGIGMAPARKWREGINRAGRPTVDDVGQLDKVLGRIDRCVLTAEGIRLNNHRFHDQRITSELLDRLLRHAKVREQRKSKLATGTVRV